MEYSAVYKQETKLLDKFDPRTKLAWCGLLIYLAFTRESMLHLSIVFALALLAAIVLSDTMKHYKGLALLLLLLGVQIFILQVLFCREGTLLAQWGIIKIYSEALPNAITGTLKAGIIVIASMQFLNSSTSTDFTLMLMKFKIPYRFAMLVGLCARFIPVMKSEYKSIVESQSTRGLKMESVWDQIKSIIPTSMPFLFRALRRATEVALTMELRGYGRSKNRTFTYDIAMKNYDVLLIIGMLVFVAIDLGRMFFTPLF